MDWHQETLEMFHNLLEETPADMREMVETMVERQAEIFARDSDKDLIGEAEMLEAYFYCSPPRFRPQLIGYFEQVGVDLDEYEDLLGRYEW